LQLDEAVFKLEKTDKGAAGKGVNLPVYALESVGV
jgi:hypothetical protein